MLFRLKVYHNGQIEYWTYDNHANAFYNPQGINPLEQFKATNYEIVYPFWGKDTQYSIKSSIELLYIVLGLKCNFHCAYCHQTDLAKSTLPESSPDKVDGFIEMLKRAQLNITDRIMLWGGEPLVYWKTLRLLIPKLRQLYPNIEITCITNGALLNDEIYNFFITYGVRLIVSYDGENSKNRDYPTLAEPNVAEATKRALKRGYGKRFSILPLMSHGNPLPSDVQKEVNARFGERISVGYHSIFKCNNEDNTYAELGALTEQERANIKAMMDSELAKPMHDMDNSMKARMLSNIAAIVQGIPFNSVRTSCASSLGSHVSIDFDGNVLSCMNDPFRSYGHITDRDNVKLDCFYSHQRKKCKDCYLVNQCFGVCPLLKDDTSRAFEITCENIKPFAQAYFENAVSGLFGVKLISVEAIDENQTN